MRTAQSNFVLRHILDEAVACALKSGVAMGDVAATMIEVLARLAPVDVGHVQGRTMPVGETREQYVATHVAHQLTDQAAVLALYGELMQRPGVARDVLMSALRTVAIEPAESALHHHALQTVERLLTAQAMVHGLASWTAVAQCQEVAPCAMH